MNGETGKGGSEAGADMAAWDKRLGHLEAQVTNLRATANRARRRGFSKGIMLGLAPSLIFLFLIGTMLYAQSSGDALFIDPRGWIGIGMNKPNATLDVAGKLNVSDNATLSNGFVGDVGHGADYAGFSHRNSANTTGYGFLHHKAGQYTLINKKSGAGFIGFRIDNVDKMVVADNGNIGIGTTTPSAKLEVSLKNALADGWKGNLKALRLLSPDSSYFLDVNTYIVAGGNVGYQLSPNFSEKGKPVKSEAGLVITTPGNVGIGTTDPKDKLEVAGALRVLTGSNPIRFTSGWSGFPDEKGVTNQAEIANDTGTYKSLMIVGNKSGGGTTRRVQVYDQLEVKGALFVSSGLNYYWGPDKQWKHIENRGGDWAGSYNSAAPVSSDLRLKSDLQSIPSALNKVRALRAVTYRWNEAALRYFTRDIETTISAGPNATEEENRKVWQKERNKRYKELANTLVGVVAQDVEAVLPEAVSTDEAGYKSVRYQYLIPLLIEALKEQDQTVKDQAQILAHQQQEIARLAAANLAVQQQLADLAAVRAQVARLEATLQRGAAARSFVVPDAATRPSTAQAR